MNLEFFSSSNSVESFSQYYFFHTQSDSQFLKHFLMIQYVPLYRGKALLIYVISVLLAYNNKRNQMFY